MIEVEEGDFVRTENGEIHKVEDIEDLRIHIETDKTMFRTWVEDYYGCHKEDRFITKHSKNLIDLIEEHDIIEFEYNGAVYKEEVIRYDDGDTYYYELSFSPEDGIDYNISIFDADVEIISILTHEEFEMRKYKVKEN